MTSDAYKLPLSIYSPRQIDSFIFDLEAYLVWLRDRSVQEKAGKPSDEAAPLSAELLNFLNDFSENRSQEISEVERLIIYLREVRHSPLVHVVLPTFASGAVKEQIVTWFREEVYHGMLVAFTVDTSILGGIVVRTVNGIYDYSFVNKLIAERKRFPEIMRHV